MASLRIESDADRSNVARELEEEGDVKYLDGARVPLSSLVVSSAQHEGHKSGSASSLDVSLDVVL